MEIHDEPVGYFITWTVYGTFLQGDARWWRKRTAAEQPPQPLLEQWHRDRLKHDVILLNDDTPQSRRIRDRISLQESRMEALGCQRKNKPSSCCGYSIWMLWRQSS